MVDMHTNDRIDSWFDVEMDMEIEWYGGWGRDMKDGLIVIGRDRKKICGGLSVKGWQARKEKLCAAVNKSCRISNGWRKKKNCRKRENRENKQKKSREEYKNIRIINQRREIEKEKNENYVIS